MYIQNRRDGCKFKGCSPLQLLNGLTGLKSAIAYFAYACPLCGILKDSRTNGYMEYKHKRK